MNKPNFFIVGAPKCGTTALARYLSEHPDVFVTNPKEPLYYLDPKDPYRKIQDERHYGALFRNVRGEKAIGEASVWYLYSNTAMENIKSNYPDAKIIIMNRDPVQLAASLHSQMYFGGCEKERELEIAWRRECERFSKFESDSLRTIECMSDWRLLYPELINVNKYISRYKAKFGDSNVLVIDNSEMRNDPVFVYRSVLGFLGVCDDGRTDFSQVNANKIPRSILLRNVLLFINNQKFLLDMARKFKSKLGISTLGIYAKVRAFNVKEEPRVQLSKQLTEDIYNTWKAGQ